MTSETKGLAPQEDYGFCRRCRRWYADTEIAIESIMYSRLAAPETGVNTACLNCFGRAYPEAVGVPETLNDLRAGTLLHQNSAWRVAQRVVHMGPREPEDGDEWLRGRVHRHDQGQR